MIRTDADQRIAAGAIGQGAGKWGSESIDLPTGYEYLDTDVIGSIGPRHQMPLEPMPLLIIGLYFNKIKFTQHVDGEDIFKNL
ncbi:MAG TPA: hypothetical protein EYQ20_21605, partial [candidate division Zixibacteria bacterium]|nr:hypothetical protein [candidate division Zixibacteria bacterium]